MPNCDFYATGSDCAAVLEFIFEQPGWELHELASAYDERVRKYHSTESILGDFPFGSSSLHFQLYAPEMRGKVVHRKIVFNEGAVPGHTHRYDTVGWGLIQVYFGHTKGSRLTASHTNHNSERRATTWSATERGLGKVSAWDWAAVTRASSRLNRFLRKLAPSRHGSRPVLPAAHAALEAGRVELGS